MSLEPVELEETELIQPVSDLTNLFNPSNIAAMASVIEDALDPDCITLSDVYLELAELRACVDWLAQSLIAAAEAAPTRFAPQLKPYPPELEE